MKRLKKVAPLILGAALVAGHLYAQPSGSPVPSDPSRPQKQVQLSPEQMTREAQSLRVRVRADIQRVHHLRQVARKAQDVIKLTCVNDKFVRLKAEANLFDEAHRDLLAVIDSHNRQSAYTRVLKAASDVRKAREEADVCIGQPELGDTANDFMAPDVLEDPTLGLPFDISIEPPAYASPYI